MIVLSAMGLPPVYHQEEQNIPFEQKSPLVVRQSLAAPALEKSGFTKTVGESHSLVRRRELAAFITAVHRSLIGTEKLAAADMHIKLGEYQFRYICAIQPERNADGLVKQYMPQSRYKNKNKWPLNKYGNGPFCKFRIPNNYNVSGVYAVFVEGELKYIGECLNLSSRFNMGYGIISPRNCFAGGQETNCRLNNLIYQAANAGRKISLWFIQTEDYKTIERKLLVFDPPEWNRI